MGEPLGSKYLVEELLGRGAGGEVFRGVDQSGAEYAIKKLRPELASDLSVVLRFVRERSILLGVHDANLVGVHDLVVEGNTLAIVMDLVRGRDLRHALAETGPFPPAEVARIGAGVARALAAVHAAGVVHRDVKPENVLLDDTTAPPGIRLSDFGISRLVADSELARTTALIGTPLYMAPELLEGALPDPASDLYALGATLYELSCGLAPFAGSTVGAVMHRHLAVIPGRPDGIPDPIWNLLAAMLAKPPSERPTSARAVAETLEQLSLRLLGAPAAPPISVAPPGTPVPTRPPAVPVPQDRPDDAARGEVLLGTATRQDTEALPIPSTPAPQQEHRRQGSGHRGRLVGALLAVIFLLAIGGGGYVYLRSGERSAAPPPIPPAVPVPSDSASPTGSPDGALRIGTLLPESGSQAAQGPPQIDAVKLAVRDINAAGGVQGRQIQLEEADSGDKEETAAQSLARLLDDKVGAIVAANVTPGTMDQITGKGVLEISPSATSSRLSSVPQAHRSFFRTAPSDDYQGQVLGRTARREGARTMGILVRNNVYANNLADLISDSFSSSGGTVSSSVQYDPKTTDFSTQVAAIRTANPDAIVLIGFGETAEILTELRNQGLLPLPADGGRHLYLVDANMSEKSYLSLAEGAMAGVEGTIPGVLPTVDLKTRLRGVDPGLTDFSYAAEAYDATVVVALAAEEAKSIRGSEIATRMQNVTSGSRWCRSFAECDGLVKSGAAIHYEGLSGPIDFDADGDPTVAWMGVYRYGNDNTYQPLSDICSRQTADGWAQVSPSSCNAPASGNITAPPTSPGQ